MVEGGFGFGVDDVYHVGITRKTNVIYRSHLIRKYDKNKIQEMDDYNHYETKCFFFSLIFFLGVRN